MEHVILNQCPSTNSSINKTLVYAKSDLSNELGKWAIYQTMLGEVTSNISEKILHTQHHPMELTPDESDS